MRNDIIKISSYDKYTNAKNEHKFDNVMQILTFDVSLYESLRDCNIFELNTTYICLKGLYL